MSYFKIKMSLMLTSIPSCDNNSRTISKKPLFAAQNKAVSLKIGIKFHKKLYASITLKI